MKEALRINKVSIPGAKPPLQPITSFQLVPGTLFKFRNGSTFYMKTDDDSLLNLNNGALYPQSSHGEVEVLSALLIERA